MPARFLPLVTDQYYHLFNRGVNKQPIFFGLRDYKRILEIMEFYSFNNIPLRYSKFLLLPNEEKEKIWLGLRKENNRIVEFICYCLMPNHFHFLIKQTKDNGVSKFMRIVQNSYTRYFNTKHKRIRPILQGQFKAVRIEGENQLIHLSRYIHLNPYTSFIVKTLDDLKIYHWSSLPEFINQIPKSICSKEIILSNFKLSEDYLEFVFNQAAYQRELDRVKHLTLE